MTETAIAFFDFDGTLCKGDSIMPFLFYAVRHGEAPVSQLFRAAAGFLKQARDPSCVVEAKERTLSFMTGCTQGEMNDLARRFIRDRLVPDFFPEGLAELERLRAENVRIVLVSASPDVYMRMMPEFLPVDDVIATPCLLDEQGLYTGRIACNCKGEEKPRLIAAWLKEHNLQLDRSRSSAYGDSFGDSFMMRMTAHPVLVNPADKLKRAMPGARIVTWHTKR